jgi:eukaryotic-like serine/threonine-protein kinase
MICPSCATANSEDANTCGGCRKPLPKIGNLQPGFSVADRYEIRRFLGEGGMGAVYEAYDQKLEEKVALKLLKYDSVNSPELERRFRHEIKLARRLRHRNVCAIHEYGESGALRYIAMELIEGEDLKKRLRRQGALPTAEAFEVSIQMARGLECIHEAGVVHRDLKASNVMLDPRGDVHLMDFGIAKQLGADATMSAATAVGNIVGTPEYMSPEQARGEPIDGRSDLYSLGIVIYEIFTGQVPFRGETPIATLFKNLQDPPTLDGPIASGIPGALKPVLFTVLAKSPSERFASVQDLTQALVQARDAALGAGRTLDSKGPSLPGTTAHGARTAPARGSAVPAPATPPPLPRVEREPSPTRVSSPTVLSQVSPTTALPRSAMPPPPTPAASAPWRAAPSTANRSRASSSVAVAGIVLVGLAAVGGIAFVGARLLGHGDASTPPPQPAASADVTLAAAPSPAIPARALPSPLPSEKPSGEVGGMVSTPEPHPSPAAVTYAPTPRPATPPPVTEPRQTATPVPPEPGSLLLYVKPWAEVSVDGRPMGTTPLRPIILAAGVHKVELTHPAYRPLVRQVVVAPGGKARLDVDFSGDGQRREE